MRVIPCVAINYLKGMKIGLLNPIRRLSVSFFAWAVRGSLRQMMGLEGRQSLRYLLCVRELG